MKYYLLELSRNIGGPMTAGIKAREDVEAILRQAGFADLRLLSSRFARTNAANKLLASFETETQWRRIVKQLQPGDVLAVQLPPSENTLFLGAAIRKLHNKGVRTVAVVHDLETVRAALMKKVRAWKRRLRIYLEETVALRYFDRIIVHNEHMRALMIELGYAPGRLVSLGIFDYLTGTPSVPPEKEGDPDAVAVAGNLLRDKSGYVYALSEIKGCNFNLYGVNYSGAAAENLRYLGAFPSDTLPLILNGRFGLVWDGPAAETCAGVYGEYLKLNNPHKTSLYLAAGLPVIVWSAAATADFVKENGCGITVDSLYDLPAAINSLPDEAYAGMKRAAEALSVRLKNGEFLKTALQTCE